MTPNFLVVVNGLLPICCHIFSGVEDFVLLSVMTFKGARYLAYGRNEKIRNDQANFETKSIKANLK